jgi:hypothetical protein
MNGTDNVDVMEKIKASCPSRASNSDVSVTLPIAPLSFPTEILSRIVLVRAFVCCLCTLSKLEMILVAHENVVRVW